MVTRLSIPLSLAAFTLAACASGPPAENTAPAEIRTEFVTYKAGDTDCKGYLAWDANRKGPRPGVLVVHEWWGHNDYAQRRARMLAELGYTALALDMYGDGKSTEHPTEAGAFMKATLADLPAAVERFEAARALLETHPTTDAAQTAAIGYCFGGGIVLGMARMGMDLDAVCSFHGSLATDSPATAGAVKAEVFVAHGEADAMVSAGDVAALKDEMAASGAAFEFHSYPYARHGFTNPAADQKAKDYGIPIGYSPVADAASWQQMQAFLARVFE